MPAGSPPQLRADRKHQHEADPQSSSFVDSVVTPQHPEVDAANPKAARCAVDPSTPVTLAGRSLLLFADKFLAYARYVADLFNEPDAVPPASARWPTSVALAPTRSIARFMPRTRSALPAFRASP